LIEENISNILVYKEKKTNKEGTCGVKRFYRDIFCTSTAKRK